MFVNKLETLTSALLVYQTFLNEYTSKSGPKAF